VEVVLFGPVFNWDCIWWCVDLWWSESNPFLFTPATGVRWWVIVECDNCQ